MLSEMPLLTEIALILLAALAVLVAADELGLSPIPGWLLAGMLLGPGAFGWLRDPLLQAGLLEGCGAMLLFIVGVELRRRRPAGRRPRGLLVGGVHTLMVTGGIAGVLLSQGLDWRDGAFTATTLALGCGALILPVAMEHPALTEGASELTDGIFRAHVAATVLAAILPVLLGGGWLGVEGDRWMLVASATALGLAGAAAWRRWRQNVTAETDVLLLAALAAASIWLATTLGASLLVGALVAGLLVGQREGQPAGVRAILRLRGVCSAGFFLMLGTQVDLHILARHAGLVLTLIGTGLGATLLATLAGGAVLRAPPRSAVLAGLLLAPTGTLSLALTESGQRVGFLPLGGMAGGEQVLLAAAAPLLLITPLVLRQPRAQPAVETLVSGSGAADSTMRASTVPSSAVLLVGEPMLSDPLVAQIRQSDVPLYHLMLDESAPSPQLGRALHAVEGLEPAAGAALVLTTTNLLAAQMLLIRAHRRVPGLPTLALVQDTRSRAFLELLGAEPVVRDDAEGYERLLVALLAHIVQGSAWRGEPALMLGEPDARGRERRLVAVAPGVTAVGQPLGALGLERTYGMRLVAIYQSGRKRLVPTHRQRVWAGDVLVLEGQAQQFAALVAALFRRPG